MLSMAFLFLSFSLAYVYTRTQNGANGVHLPPIFLGNALLLVLSSWTINRANKAYLADDTLAYQQALLWTLILTLVFLIAQIAAWTVFKATLLGDNIGNGSNYLYAISGLHFAHVVGGLPFLSVFWWVSIKRMKEPVSVLIYFSDPTKKLRLELLTMYWHFLDGLWVFLMLFFLVNML
jgi:cytochrome c oxidase subunit 3